MDLYLPDHVKTVLDSLHRAGHEAYIVGGCVRDALMGKIPHDYDITTAATPETVTALFPHTVATGIRHGTVTVIADKNPIEVTTFRTESGYKDHRRPDKVEFVSDLREDLSRRDFTINAMAYSGNGEVVDLFGGKDDLKNGILRAVGDADTRFTEDALRILRLFRFAAVLGFDCAPDTLAAALRQADGLRQISHERIAAELEKAVLGDLSKIEPLTDCGALDFMGIHPAALSALNRLPEDENLRLFGFLKATAPDMEKTAAALKLSNTRRDFLRHMDELCRSADDPTVPAVKRLLRDHGETVFSFADYSEALFGNGNALNNTAKAVLQSGEAYLLRDLCVSGDDLNALGIRGTAVGQTLRFLLDAVIDDPTRNRREILLELARKAE